MTLSVPPSISLRASGHSSMRSMRPGSASITFRWASTSADPVIRNRPGTVSASTARLSSSKQRRRVLDLIDHRRPPEARDEACGVIAGGLAGGPVVECHEAHRVVAVRPRDVGHERRLADLPGSGHEDDPRVVEALGNERLDETREEFGHDPAMRKCGVPTARTRSIVCEDAESICGSAEPYHAEGSAGRCHEGQPHGEHR